GAPPPPQTRGHTLLELSWTIAPALVLLLIAIPTIQVIFRTQAAPAAGALEVLVRGRQWWWEFRYPALDVATANGPHLPAGRPGRPRRGGQGHLREPRLCRLPHDPRRVGRRARPRPHHVRGPQDARRRNAPEHARDRGRLGEGPRRDQAGREDAGAGPHGRRGPRGRRLLDDPQVSCRR